MRLPAIGSKWREVNRRTEQVLAVWTVADVRRKSAGDSELVVYARSEKGKKWVPSLVNFWISYDKGQLEYVE